MASGMLKHRRTAVQHQHRSWIEVCLPCPGCCCVAGTAEGRWFVVKEAGWIVGAGGLVSAKWNRRRQASARCCSQRSGRPKASNEWMGAAMRCDQQTAEGGELADGCARCMSARPKDAANIEKKSPRGPRIEMSPSEIQLQQRLWPIGRAIVESFTVQRPRPLSALRRSHLIAASIHPSSQPNAGLERGPNLPCNVGATNCCATGGRTSPCCFCSHHAPADSVYIRTVTAHAASHETK